jgi:hypothetical protein
MRRLSTNVNYYIWVKLTKEGREIYYEHHKDIYPMLLRAGYGIPAIVEEDGWSKFQMWDFMQIFGSHIHMGICGPMETQIEIEVEDEK